MCHWNIKGVTNKGMGFNTSILDIDFIVSGARGKKTFVSFLKGSIE